MSVISKEGNWFFVMAKITWLDCAVAVSLKAALCLFFFFGAVRQSEHGLQRSAAPYTEGRT